MHLALNDYLGNANDALLAGERALASYQDQLAIYARSLSPATSPSPAKLLLLAGAFLGGWYLYRKLK